MLNWWRARHPRPAPQLAKRLGALPPAQPPNERPLAEQPWVVLDLETTGLDVQRDQVLSMGAVAICNGAIDLGQGFARTLRRDPGAPTPAVLLHGLGPSEIAAGSPPEQALVEFLEWLDGRPMLAFHARFDQQMLARALRDSLGYRLDATVIDVAELAPMLNPRAEFQQLGLDHWISHFNLDIEARHSASADAQVTAELLLILLHQAQRQGITSGAALCRELGRWRRGRQGLSM